ncbi:hypothetical protein EFL95_14075 [Nocardioides marmorisolisilvae]|uniref:Uncharacterized protein n=1 Tax=Nocardioides marmorisolisilvae TaxID=1542737 RepID=A0A3N0DWW8_9ACTN|nr:hypothetical protein EFL95_14075 [Nocardioides marmorisolisilvae]
MASAGAGVVKCSVCGAFTTVYAAAATVCRSALSVAVTT